MKLTTSLLHETCFLKTSKVSRQPDWNVFIKQHNCVNNLKLPKAEVYIEVKSVYMTYVLSTVVIVGYENLVIAYLKPLSSRYMSISLFPFHCTLSSQS